jgi:hypothetical protein
MYVCRRSRSVAAHFGSSRSRVNPKVTSIVEQEDVEAAEVA